MVKPLSPAIHSVHDSMGRIVSSCLLKSERPSGFNFSLNPITNVVKLLTPAIYTVHDNSMCRIVSSWVKVYISHCSLSLCRICITCTGPMEAGPLHLRITRTSISQATSTTLE